uniref:BACK domain-containing protein n=1 Tax=Rodentolepis nana TaxID=102285 RepID=A0A158QJC7_RODNA
LEATKSKQSHGNGQTLPLKQAKTVGDGIFGRSQKCSQFIYSKLASNYLMLLKSTQLDRLNSINVWSAGSVTSNNDLIGACIPRIACDFERLAPSQSFLQHVGVEQLQLLLQSPWISDGNEVTKFKALCTWMNASSLNCECTKREKNFDRLLELINTKKLQRDFVIETLVNGSDFNLSENARTKMLVGVHGRMADSRCGVLDTFPKLNGSVYTLGGKKRLGESISRVERINPQNGEVTVLQPMIEERSGHSAVARDHAILVFGGYNNRRGAILDSCEEFQPAFNTWVELSPMPTPRYGTGAAHIPGVGDIVVGGCGKIRTLTQSVDKAEIFLTPSSPLGHAGSWCEIAPMLHSRAYPKAEFFNGNVYVAGDFEGSTFSVEMLSLFSNGPPQWTEVINASFRPVSMISFNGSLLFACESNFNFFLNFMSLSLLSAIIRIATLVKPDRNLYGRFSNT